MVEESSNTLSTELSRDKKNATQVILINLRGTTWQTRLF
jgi:hypothetical protein